MKSVFASLILVLWIAGLAGCNSAPARARAAAAEPPPRVITHTHLLGDQVRMQAEYGQRSQLIQQYDRETPRTRRELREAEERYGVDRNRRYVGSQQDNYVRLSFHNEGSRAYAIEVRSIRTTIGRFSATPSTLTIEPGEEVRINPFFFNYPLHMGPFEVEVRLLLDSSEESAKLTLTRG